MACGAPQRDAKKSGTRTELAKDFLSRQELQSARLEAQKALKLDSQNSEAHSVMGLVSFLEALNNFRLLEVDECLTGVDAEGLRVEMEQHLRSADEDFGMAIRFDPSYSEAFANRASVAILLEEYPKAVEFLTTALEVPHRLADLGLARANMGWAQFHQGNHIGATKHLRQALQFNPDMCVAKYRLGRVYFEREEWNKALEQFQAVVGSEGCPLQEAHLYLIKTMNHLGKRENLADSVGMCMELASNSCIAAQCQAEL